MTEKMNLLDFFLIVAFLGATQTLFAFVCALVVTSAIFPIIKRGSNGGR